MGDRRDAALHFALKEAQKTQEDLAFPEGVEENRQIDFKIIIPHLARGSAQGEADQRNQAALQEVV